MNPLSYNMLSQTGFRLVTMRLPELEYWCQGITLPSVAAPVLEQPTPFTNIPHPGRKVQFSPLVAQFKVDEFLYNYFSISDWIIQNAISDDFDQYEYTDTNTELLLTVLDSNERAKVEITFEGAFPISLSDLQFTSTATDVQYITATAQFAFRRYFHKLVE